MQYDIKSDLLVLLAMIETITTDTTTSGDIIDTANFELGIMFAMAVANFTDGSYELQIFESDDDGMSGATVVSGDQLIGDLPTLVAATAGGAAQSTVGVISHLRYLQARIVSTITTVGADVVISATQKGETLPIA